jgi:hypothetical protein
VVLWELEAMALGARNRGGGGGMTEAQRQVLWRIACLGEDAQTVVGILQHDGMGYLDGNMDLLRKDMKEIEKAIEAWKKEVGA